MRARLHKRVYATWRERHATSIGAHRQPLAARRTITYIRPGFLITHIANPIASRLGRVPALIVRGRTSGRLLTVPMGEPLVFEGRRYLVSGRGETHWVRNLRAAGGGSFRMHGTTRGFRATEITDRDHDRLVAAYRRELGHSVDRYFREIPDPAAHPVFRMDPLPDQPSEEPPRAPR